MDTNERENDKSTHIDKDTHINLILNNAQDGDEEISLGNVFRNFKNLKRIYAWVLLLCFVAGICASLLWYQFTEEPLKVSSVVTLNYQVPNPKFNEALDIDETNPLTVPVSDLTAPDGTELDLNQITGSHVLQEALKGLELSHPVTLANLRANIHIDKILTEDSRRQQEVAASMIADKNTAAYTQVQEIALTYENQFVVSLTNGFGDADSRVKYNLTDQELRLMLDRILAAYNNYLFTTYADIQLPDDEISVIDTEKLDILESLDLLRTAVTNLYDYCDTKSETIKAYRSWQTGRSLTDLMNTLNQVLDVNVDYLYSYVYTNSIVRNRDDMIINYQFQLRNAQTDLDVVNENISTTQTILDNYKNDQIFVSMQESDTAKSTQTTTDYYNKTIIQQADNYSKATDLEIKISDYADKLANLDSNTATTDIEQASTELDSAIKVCHGAYDQVLQHMEEIIGSAFYNNYADHSTAQGKSQNFIVGASKKLIIGAIAGIVIGLGLWFLAALMPEFRNKKEEELEGKEATER